MTFFYIALSAFLFAVSHPNVLLRNGFPLCAFFFMTPVFFVLRRSSLKKSFLFGCFHGFIFYLLFAYWAFYNYRELYLLALVLLSVCTGVVFLCMSLLSRWYERWCFYIMALVWCVFEYLRTLGPLGLSYGIAGYTQWKNPLMLSVSSVTGIWGVSFFCVCTSACVADIWRCAREKKRLSFRFFMLPSVLTVIFAVCVCCSLWQWKTFSAQNMRTIRVVAVQNNTDSRKYNGDVYKRDIRMLEQLTKEALEVHPDADFVIWPETAVVPPIVYHYGAKVDFSRYNTIYDMLLFMSDSDVAFVLGNQHSVAGDSGRKDYNAALVFDGKGACIPPSPEVYEKIHLVPFSESLPFFHLLKPVYDIVVKDRSRYWEAGKDFRVFETKGVAFSTPICFEDTFGSFCRQYVKNGAQVLFNLSNDSWSASSVCQRQHLSMAVFRSSENCIPSVRSTASGISCVISSDGKVVVQAEEFAPTWVYGELAVPELPVSNSQRGSFYTRYGDFFAVVQVILVSLLFLLRLAKTVKNGVL